MKPIKNKAGRLGGAGMVYTAIASFVGMIVLFQLYSTLVPTAQTAGDDLNATGVPLGSFFVSSGVIWVIIMAALVLLIITSFIKRGK